MQTKACDITRKQGAAHQRSCFYFLVTHMNKPLLTNLMNTNLSSKLLVACKVTTVDEIIGADVDNDSLILHICSRPSKKKPRTLRSITLSSDQVQNQLGVASANVAALLTKQRRKMLIIINPVSGKKKGVQLWQRCLPILQAANIDCVEIITTGTAHATQVIRDLSSMEMASYDGVVAVGGDGILFEVVEGFMQRDDWLTQIKSMPVAIVPAGSGNGLALSVLHRKNETRDVESMAYLIARGEVSPMDLCSVESPSKKTFSFLSTEWALASDIDITSEKYRCCGDFRFTCRGIELVFCDGCVRKYTGTLHYLPVENDASSHNHGGSDIETGGSKEIEEKNGVDTSDVAAEQTTSLHDMRTLLPPIDQTIGTEHHALGWKTLEGNDWQYFIAMQTTHQAADMFGAPGSELDDGTIMLCYGKNVSCAPCTMTSWLCNMENGEHLEMKDCQTLKVKAFRLEAAGGIIAVDGERVPLEPIQVEVHPSLMRIFS